DQTLGGIRDVDAAAILRFHDSFIIEVRLIAEQRQLEAGLAADGAVAIGVGASRLGKDRNDVLDETELGFFSRGSRQRGREQQHCYTNDHREPSSAVSIFNSMGGETVSPARSRNDFSTIGPVALTRSSIWFAPG